MHKMQMFHASEDMALCHAMPITRTKVVALFIDVLDVFIVIAMIAAMFAGLIESVLPPSESR